MTDRDERAAEIAAMWKSSGGQNWVEARSLLDRTFKPLEDLLVEAALRTEARRVLDVGCGTGPTTVAIARRLGPDGHCTGLDISEGMLEGARARATEEGIEVEFLCADAATHDFETGAYDLIVSRFGVMFFADPVAAFANLRRACTDDGGLCCIVWRAAEDNPFMTTAERAAEPLLPGVTRRDANEPGQFGLADPALVETILEQSGWHGISIEALDVPCAIAANELELYMSRLGPVGRALADHDEATRTAVMERVLPAFETYRHGDEIRFVSACWMLRAKNSV